MPFLRREELLSLFRRVIPFPGCTAGMVGYGAFGRLVADCARESSCRVLLNDPPLEREASSEIFDAFQAQWGNGMGRCDYSDTLTETFLPLETLIKECDILSIQVPGTEENHSLISPRLFARLKPHALILNFSSFKVVPLQEKRVLFLGEEA